MSDEQYEEYWKEVDEQIRIDGAKPCHDICLILKPPPAPGTFGRPPAPPARAQQEQQHGAGAPSQEVQGATRDGAADEEAPKKRPRQEVQGAIFLLFLAKRRFEVKGCEPLEILGIFN